MSCKCSRFKAPLVPLHAVVLFGVFGPLPWRRGKGMGSEQVSGGGGCSFKEGGMPAHRYCSRNEYLWLRLVGRGEDLRVAQS